MEYIKSKIRDVVDFPTKGILFKDLTTAFKDPRALHIIGWDLSQLYRDKGVTKVVGIESRGFIGGSNQYLMREVTSASAGRVERPLSASSSMMKLM